MPVWILDTGSSNHLASSKSLPGRLRRAIQHNAHAVRLATANGVITTTDIVDIEVPLLGAMARVLLLPNTPNVLSIGRMVEDEGCSFRWSPGCAELIGPDGTSHRCEVRNYVPHLGRDQHPDDAELCYLATALPAGVGEEDALELPDVEAGGWHDHELHHLPKRDDCPTCAQAKVKMRAARRRDPALRERPEVWGHTLMGDHLSAADLGLEAVDLKLGITLLDAGTMYGDLIVVRSKNTNDTIMAFREFYGEDPAYYFYSDNAPELKAAAQQELMVHLTSTPHRPESNGVVERFNQLIVDGARCLLLQSGLPGRYWHYACRAFLLARNALVKGKDGNTSWSRRFGKNFHGKLIPFGAKVLYRRPKHDAAKFAPRGSEGIMLGHHLEPGGIFKGDYLVLNIDNLIGTPARSTIHRVKEVVRAPGPNEYPLREAQRAKRDRDTADIVEDGILETLEEEEDVEMPTAEEIEDMERPLAIEDEVIIDDDIADGTIQRIPRGSRIFIPRVGPPPKPSMPSGPLDDATGIQFNEANPKRPHSRSYELYEKYKAAKTVGEAIALGATRGHIKYDISKGFATLDVAMIIICIGNGENDDDAGDPEAAFAAPLLEAWCDPHSTLGEIGREFDREVFRFTERDDLSKPETVKSAFRLIRQHPGCHLHGSLPCTPWSAWQRLNMVKADDASRQRVFRAREQSMEWAATFLKMARSVIAKGGTVSFEWPRYCEGWNQPLIKDMIRELRLQPVPVDGCAVGLKDKSNKPLYKPWTIAVSSPFLAEQLKDLRCDKTHEHGKTAGPETAKTAFYPRTLCEAIHRGLDAHEDQRRGGKVPALIAEAGNQPSVASAPGFGPGGNQPLAVDLCTPKAQTKQASALVSPGFEPRLQVSLSTDDLTGPAEDSVPATVRPLRALDAGRRPILEHNVCRDGEQEMERALAAAADWPYADEPPPSVAEGHRQRLREPPCGILFALVTRLIANSSAEAKSAGCMKALKKEKDKMVAREVWNENGVDEWANVRSKDREASVGRIFSILGEKHAERRVLETDREYKARIVFAGNNIQTASGIAPHELFQEVSSAPAAMASVRATLAIGALRGFRPMMRDAAQAYIQARIDGPGRPATWVRLPRYMWPATWFDAKGQPRYKDPVVPLHKALYGHPESGALWEKHLAEILTSLGWSKCDSHPGVWIHDQSGAMLAVYVDDLLMVAPRDLEKKLWDSIAAKVSFDEDPSPIGKFLGAHHTINKDGKVTRMTVEMEDFLRDAAAIYATEIGSKRLAEVRTPYLPESVWDFAHKGNEQVGEQSSTCSSHLMKLLFAARLSRPDIIVPITRLASKVSSWNASHDRALKRLMQYVATRPELNLHSALSTDDLADVQLVMWPDADLAGDLETAKSTTGMYLELRSLDGARSWPLSWRSKRQGSTATSTCEAEYIAMSTSARAEAIPMQVLLERALGRRVDLICLEDNTQCLTAVKTGYSAALRSLPRTERISLSVAHETFVLTPGNEIRYHPTETHKGDAFTKRLDPNKFEIALELLGLRPVERVLRHV